MTEQQFLDELHRRFAHGVVDYRAARAELRLTMERSRATKTYIVALAELIRRNGGACQLPWETLPEPPQ